MTDRERIAWGRRYAKSLRAVGHVEMARRFDLLTDRFAAIVEEAE